MSDTSLSAQDADPVWARLRGLWTAVDPVPSDLTAKVLASLAVEDVDEEYELLQLLEAGSHLAGARSTDEATSTTMRTSTIQFTHERVSVLLRVSALDTGHCRVDGWVVPPAGHTASLRDSAHEWRTTIDASGRFEFPSVPVGPVRLWLDGPTDSFTTTMFEL